jgi:diadenylate cyclase
MSALAQSVRVRDVVDLALALIVVACIVLLARGSRSAPVVTGLAGLLVVSLAARRLDLLGSGWGLDGFWAFWALVLVVLFQPELRRALAQLARSPLFQRMTRATQEAQGHVLEDVVKAAEALAGKRMGALVVLERTMGLEHYAELGVPLEARVSPDLLVSLFLPYSPLHDGAVIIREERLAAAGCFLPLSRNAQVGRQLGTRHRAALGLSEETDAVVVAVSEENGRISLAVGGQLEVPAEPEALRRRLAELFSLADAPAPRGLAAWARR